MNIESFGTECAWSFFPKDVGLFLSPSDVFFMSPTGCYYWLRCEDVPEDVSLLLRCEGQSPDQRESLTRDLPVSHFAFGLFCINLQQIDFIHVKLN